jgi:hypothetical protein
MRARQFTGPEGFRVLFASGTPFQGGTVVSAGLKYY